MIIDSPIISGSYSASGSLNQFGNVVVSGSLTVTGSIIGTASYAATASYLSGYVSPFPYTGSAIISGSLEVTGSANIPNITGSLLGTASTASFVQNAQTASFVTTAQTASFVQTAQTAYYVLNAVSSSFATSASNALTASYLTGYVSPFPFTGSAIISGSLTVTGSVAADSLQGTGVRYLVADESGSITAQSASAALKSTQAFTATAGQTSFNITNGYTTGLVDVFINGTKLSATEFTDTSGTVITLATGSNDGDTVEFVKYFPASGVTNNALRQLTQFTATAGQTVFSASYTPGLLDIYYNGARLSTSDYTANNGTYFTLATASAADDILDVLVYSYQVGAFNGIGGQGVVNQLAFFNTTSSITGSDSFTVSGNTLVGTASYASNADTLDGAHLSTLATTGSNTFTSAQYVSNTSTPIGFTDTASVYTDGGIRATKTSYFSSSLYVGGDLIIFGSQSVNYITSSQLNIADNIITVNTSTPAVRFGGIAVQDSGSLATGLTGSLLWDSQNNNWIYSNPSGSGNYDSAMVMMGPQNSSGLGNEVGLTLNSIPKGAGGHHMTSSAIFEVSGSVGIGTSSPTSLLTVNGSTLTSQLYGGSLNSTRIYLDADQLFGVYGSEGSSTARWMLSRDLYTSGGSGISLGAVSAWAGMGVNNNANGNGNALMFVVNSTSPTNLSASGSEMMRITTSGVGIGTTSPSYKLDVRHSSAAVFGSTSTLSHSSGFLNHSYFMAPNMTGGGLSVAFGKSNSTYNVAKIVYNHVGDASSSNYIGLGFWDADNILNVLANGKVGIGTASPAFKLSVANEMIVGAQGGTDYTYIRGGSGFGSMIRNYYAGGSVNNELSGNGNNLLSLVTGNVGIGIAVPTQKLDVYGNMAINDQEFRWRTGTDQNHGTKYDGTTNGPFMYGYFGAALGYNTGTGTNTRVIWSNTTNAYNYNNSTTWQQTSDIRIKQNIRPISNVLDKIVALNPTHFEFKTKPGITKTGFIAQEFEQIFPGHVTEIEPTDEYKEYFEEGEKIKSIDADLVPYLVKAIQEQQSLITSLQTRIEQLENK